jgi:hypothetical protein
MHGAEHRCVQSYVSRFDIKNDQRQYRLNRAVRFMYDRCEHVKQRKQNVNEVWAACLIAGHVLNAYTPIQRCTVGKAMNDRWRGARLAPQGI